MRFGLITKFSITISGVVVLAIVTSAVAVLAARRVERLLDQTVKENIPSLRAAEELEIALLEQSRAMALYALGVGNPERLPDVQAAQEEFDQWFRQVSALANTPAEKDILDRLSKAYAEYLVTRGRAIDLYVSGNKKESEALLRGEAKLAYRQVYRICEELIAANVRYVETAQSNAQRQVNVISWITLACVATTLGLGGGLLWQFVSGVVLPLRQLAKEAREFTRQTRAEKTVAVRDELQAVGVYLKALMDDVALSQSTMEESRQRLAAAEKLASVGKLAASVAHEIRNPLTAVKMWLFSIGKMVTENPELDRKLRMVTEEIHRLESIVQNFLEFSRPPRLRLRSEPLAVVLDKTMELFQHRTDMKRISFVRNDAATLPLVMADAEQLKQVLLNVLDNAVAAIEGQGRISVVTTVENDATGGAMAVVRIEDDGHGIPNEIRTRIFEPFFSTKTEGTGLGLCIAAHIMAAHNGRVLLESAEKGCTRLAVWIPLAEGLAP